jgi:hypothetical protein
MRKLLIMVATIGLCGYAAFQLHRTLIEAAMLRQAQAQVSNLIEDAATRANAAATAPAAQVILSLEGNLREQIGGEGHWRDTTPIGNTSLVLPPGITVKGWTFPTNAMRVRRNANGRTLAWPGSITLTDQYGETAVVQVEDTGGVKFDASPDAPRSLQRAQAQIAAVFQDAIFRTTETPVVRIIVDRGGRSLTRMIRLGAGRQVRLTADSVVELPNDIHIWRWTSQAGNIVWDFGNPDSSNSVPRTIVLAACCGLTATVHVEQSGTAR